jgi:Flp pilus assembly pilin Flp
MAWVASIKNAITERISEESGQDVIEYAVLVGAIGIALFAALLLVPLPAAFGTFGNKIANCVKFSSTC